jgi:hypothetical protein
MPDVRYNKEGGSPEHRINKRLQNSGGEGADHVVHQGTGPTRTISNIHHGAGHQPLPKLPDDQQRGKS